MEFYIKYFVGYFILSGLIKAGVVTSLYLFNFREKGEKHIQFMSNLGGAFDISLLCLALIFSIRHSLPLSISFGDLFSIHSEFIFYSDIASLLQLFVAVVVLGLIGRFSCFYLHKDIHYYKFFALFYVFQTSVVLLVLSDNFTSYFIGWELLGLASVLLISFYEKRDAAVKNSIRIFSIYKISDIFLFIGFSLASLQGHSHLFSEWGDLSGTFYMFFISLAVIIKMGGFPIIWLPRAMEGPTPSSAVFYGSLATHIPVLLLIKIWANVEGLAEVRLILLVVLVITILVSTLYSRIQTDVKNMLSYSTVTHLSIIGIEAVSGYAYLASVHLALHCFYRLFQFIKSPSVLYEHHQMEGYNGGEFRAEGKLLLGNALSKKIKNYIYKYVFRNFFIFNNPIGFFDFLIGFNRSSKLMRLFIVFMFNSAAFLTLVGFEFKTASNISIEWYVLIFSWVLAINALCIKRYDTVYFITVICSACSLLSFVFLDVLTEASGNIIIQIFLFMIIVSTFFFRKKINSTMIIKKKNLMVSFILLLWLVGMPGPGTYIFFEKGIAEILSRSLYLSIGVFIVLNINILSVVKNYSLNNLKK